MNTLEVLTEAKHNIITKGWYQKEMYGPQGEVCALGAIEFAHNDDNFPAWSEAMDILDECAKMRIEIWNDIPSRTYEEVLTLYDKAIALAQQDEA